MKTLHLSIIVVIIASFVVLLGSINYSYGELVPKTLSQLYDEYKGKTILTGEVISITDKPSANLTSYDIKTDQFLTRPEKYALVTASAPRETNEKYIVYPHFKVGDKVQLYLDRGSAGYALSPYSFKMDEGCSSGFGPSYLDFEPTHGGVASEPVRFLDLNGNIIGIPTVNQKNRLSYDVFNYSPLNKTTIDMNITLNDDPNPIFHDTRQLDLKPCTGKTLTWNFVPTQMGNYTITLRQIWGIYDNKIILGNYLITNYGFSPTQITKTDMLSPLKQFKSNVLGKDIQCKEGFELVIKSEDGSPACVKQDTAGKLIERGWAKEIILQNVTKTSPIQTPQKITVAPESDHSSPSPMPITVWGHQDTFDHAKSLAGMSWISLPTKVPPNLTLAPIRVKTDSAVTIISVIYTPPGVSTSDNVTGDQVANAGGFSVTYWKQAGPPEANQTRQFEIVAKAFPNTTSLATINGHQALIFPNEIQINAGICIDKTNCSLMIDIGSRTLNSTELRPIAESIAILPHN